MLKGFGNMMKQAQQLQERMGEVQEKLNRTEAEGQSGGGAVRLVVNGKGDMTSLKIDASVVKADDVEMLEDLIIAAFSEAKGKIDAIGNAEMKKVTGGLNIPGLKLPF